MVDRRPFPNPLTPMTETTTKSRGPFRFAFILAAIHLVLALIPCLLLLVSPDAGMILLIFRFLDYPLSHYYSLLPPLSLILLLGTLLWGCYGFMLQSVVDGRRKHLAASVVAAAVICFLPELGVRTLPGWEAEWRQGTAAREDKDLPEAIRHISRAIELSPPDNPILCGMWDYLGGIYQETKDYPMAEKAFRNALTSIDANPSPKNYDRLNAYNELASFYDLSHGDLQLRKEALFRAIDENPKVYGPDSIQEADCWKQLAEIAHDAGHKDEARQQMERAIAIESMQPLNGFSSLDYEKELLQKWSTE
jgi:tetratricopeptide (TPR) repeat protein